MAIPEYLLKEWDSARNGSYLDYSRSCKQKVSWICKSEAGGACGCHVWEASISSRVIAGSGCPYCSGRRTCLHASLQTLRPDLLEEWDHVKNIVLPSEVPLGSKKKVWWKCKSGVCGCHVWEASITKRAALGGCPYCSGRRVCVHASLQTLHPNLLEEWNYTKNKVTPAEVSPGSSMKVSWICKNNTCHVWDAVVYSRTRGRGCPHCARNKRCATSSSYKEEKDTLPASGVELNMTLICSNIGCEKTWMSTMDELLDGRVCPHCAELGIWANSDLPIYLG